eukprot:Hpha_TRINITY_DN15735_c5_g2::TRINITY_DN15735_c5_g2_i1::g.41963::m.41963
MGCGSSAPRAQAHQFHSLTGPQKGDSESDEYTEPEESEESSSDHTPSLNRSGRAHRNGYGDSETKGKSAASGRLVRVEEEVDLRRTPLSEESADSGTPSSPSRTPSSAPSVSSSKFHQLCPKAASPPEEKVDEKSAGRCSGKLLSPKQAQGRQPLESPKAAVEAHSFNGLKNKQSGDKSASEESKEAKKAKREKRELTGASGDDGEKQSAEGTQKRSKERRRSRRKSRGDIDGSAGKDTSYIQLWVDSRPELPPEELTPPCSPVVDDHAERAPSGVPSDFSQTALSITEGTTDWTNVYKQQLEQESARADVKDQPGLRSPGPPESPTVEVVKKDSHSSDARRRRRASTLSDGEGSDVQKRRHRRLSRRDSANMHMAAFTGGSPNHQAFLRSRSKESFYTSKSSEWMYDLSNLKKEHDARQSKRAAANAINSPELLPQSSPPAVSSLPASAE